MYEIFESLLALHGVTAYQVAKATGIATATLSDWKRGRSTPKQDKLQKIANYFEVPLSYLLEGNPPEKDCDIAAVCLARQIVQRNSLKRLMECSLHAEDSDVELAINVLQALQRKR